MTLLTAVKGRTLVFQPRPGLGDLIWHLPIIRAIAAATPAGKITLLTKPSTQADTLLEADPAIERIIRFDRNPRTGKNGYHDGPLGYPRLIATLRAAGAETAILLHHATPLAAALRLAGIPNRHAYGYAKSQRRWLQPPFNPKELEHAEAFDQATGFAKILGFPPLSPPTIAINPAALQSVQCRLSHLPKPWIIFGIGSNSTTRQWGTRNFAELGQTLLAEMPGTIILLAAAHEAPPATRIAGASNRIQTAIGWPLREVIALLDLAEIFIGNDSGPMNLRAAAGRPACALFGASGPLTHSPLIHPIVPPAGPRAGMEQITVAMALHALRERHAF